MASQYVCLYSSCYRARSELPVFPSCVQATCDHLPLHHSWQPPPSFSKVTFLVIVLHSLKTQAFHSGVCLTVLEKCILSKALYVTNLGSKAWLCGLLCDTLASQWWLHFLHCLATDHSLLGTLLSTSVLLSIIPSLLLLTPPLWRAFYCTMVRCTVLRGKSLSPYMAQYSPIAEHQGDCLQYTQSGDGDLTRETAVTHSSSGQFQPIKSPQIWFNGCTISFYDFFSVWTTIITQTIHLA